MEFGIPKGVRGAAKEEKHPNTPVLTVQIFDEETMRARTMHLNDKAKEVMGFPLDDVGEIAFHFNPTNPGEVLVVNCTGRGIPAALKVAKNGNISNKDHFNKLREIFNKKDLSTELELQIFDTPNAYDGMPLFSLSILMHLQDLAMDSMPASAIEHEEAPLSEAVVGEETSFDDRTSDWDPVDFNDED